MQGDGKQEEADYRAEQEAEAQAQGEAEQAEYESKRRYELQREHAEKEAFNSQLLLKQKSREQAALKAHNGFMTTGEATLEIDKLTSGSLIDESNFEREIKELKVLRENAKGFQEILKGLQVRFAEKHKNMIHSMAVTNEAIGKLEASIKTKALNQYKPGGEKKLAFGVGIQERKEVFFDDDLALAWATEKGMCLKLDLSAFKKIAKVQKIKWTYIGERTIATIPGEIKV